MSGTNGAAGAGHFQKYRFYFLIGQSMFKGTGRKNIYGSS